MKGAVRHWGPEARRPGTWPSRCRRSSSRTARQRPSAVTRYCGDGPTRSVSGAAFAGRPTHSCHAFFPSTHSIPESQTQSRRVTPKSGPSQAQVRPSSQPFHKYWCLLLSSPAINTPLPSPESKPSACQLQVVWYSNRSNPRDGVSVFTAS